jgi:RHS repeat-associated protein
MMMRFRFDDIDQLTSESRTGYAASYTYDANGNRLTRTVNSVTENYYYDDADKLDEIKIGGSTVKDFSYDAAGRTTSVVTGAGTTTLAYDYESRITTITYPNTSTNTFTYNGLDTRVGKVDSVGTKTYKRDGVGVTAPVLSDGAASYTPGLSERRSGTSTFSHAGIKNQHEQTAANETSTATQTYDAFGNLVASSGTWKGPFGYGGSFGYQTDGDSGLKLLGHRYYDPSTGRFLTRDLARSGRNWFIYCNNNPISRSDPNGYWLIELLEGIRDGLIGAGDSISFGGTKIARAYIGELAGIGDANESVNDDSGWYKGGSFGGDVIGSYLGGAAAGKAWQKLGLGRLRLGGAGTWNDHIIRVEVGKVHFIPGLKATELDGILHFHILPINGLHLPYQLWPAVMAIEMMPHRRGNGLPTRGSGEEWNRKPAQTSPIWE